MSLLKFAEFEVLESFALPSDANNLQRLAARTVAHRHQFDYEPRPGYIYVRSRAISSRCNDNFDLFPAEEIKQAYRTFVGKPVFVNHKNADHRRARGYIMDAALHEDTNPDGSPDTWVEVLMEVDAIRFPRLAEACLRGDIARTSMGTDVAYSLCTACGNKAVTPADYCSHIPALKGLKIQKRLASGATEEVLIAEECHGLGFFENSLLVEPPADPTAFSWIDHDASGLSVAASLNTVADKVNRKPVDIKASEIREGDRLDASGKTRIVQRHPRTDKVLVRTQTRGTRSPSVAKWDNDEQVRVWREAALHVHAGAFCPDCDYTPRKTDIDHVPWGTGDHCSTCGHAITMTHTGWVHCASDEEHLNSIWVPGREGSYSIFQQRDDDHRPTPKHSAVAALLQSEALAYEPAGEGYCTAKGRGASRGSQCPCNEFVASSGPNTNMDGWQDCAAPGCGHSKQSHVGGAEIVSEGSLQRLAYGETKAPAKVDTMRAEECPVCGDDEGFSGEKCNVCGYTQPPSQFRDPDLSKAKEMDLRQDAAEDQGLDPADGVNTDGPVDATAPQAPGAEQGSEDLQCTNCGEVFNAEGQPEGEASTRDVLQEDPAKATDPKQPDASEDGDRKKVGPDGQPVADDKGLDPQQPKKPNPFEKKDQQEERPQEPQDPAVDPRKEPAEGEGRVTPADQSAVEKLRQHVPLANTTCPVCGKGTLIPIPAPEPQQVQDQPTEVDVPTKNTQASTASRRGGMSKETVDMNQPNPAQQNRSLMIAAIAEQQEMIERQGSMISGLISAVGSLAVAAKVDRHPAFAPIVRAAGLQRRAADSAQNPDGAPSTTTEEAKKPQATDDPTSPGAVPANANADVTPKAVTDVNSDNVAASDSATSLDNLTDVTAPTPGTDKVYPDAASGTGKVEVGSGDNSTSFDSTGPSWKSSSVERFTASLRLARLQISAGVAPEGTEDIALSERLASSEMSTEAMLAQVDALKSVTTAKQASTPAEAQRRRALVPQPQGGGIRPMAAQASVEAPAFSGGLPTIAARSGEDEWMIGDAAPGME